MKKLCIGVYANILALCSVEGSTKLKLLNSLVQSVDSGCKLSSSAVNSLLRCLTNLPDGRGNSLGNVISGAQTAPHKAVAEYFQKKVIPLLNPNKRKLAVLAIRDIIAEDETIYDDTVVETVSGTTKKALMYQSQIVLSDFLAGVFLFAAAADNRGGKASVGEITWDYLRSFEAMQDSLAFIVPQANGGTPFNSAAAYNHYLANAKEKYSEVKTLLYKDEPKQFYSFYVPNYVEHRLGRMQPVKIKDVTATTITKISNFLILDGVGGLGKSMMMRHLLLSAIKEFKTLRRIPVLIPLKSYGESTGGLLDYVFANINAIYAGIDKHSLTGMLEAGSFLLLFDGLDEIDSRVNGRFERALEEFTDQYPKNCYVISSRPYQNFVSFTRFTVLKIMPFTKEQSLSLIEKLEFRPDEPEIKEKFSRQLAGSLSQTHRSFMENPLLLTIMLLTFEVFAEIPTQMHVFYRKAFITLYETHDACKGAYRRAFKTGLLVDDFSDYFAEFCFLTYKDMKFDFSDEEFARYFCLLRINEKSVKHVNASDFAYDLCANLCLMYQEGGRYHFTHRSFQEYFCAVFFSMQKESFLERLGDFFDWRHKRFRSDQTFNMLWDMIPDKVEMCILIPFLQKLFNECDAAHGYWTFLTKMYPRIYYEKGEVNEWACNEPSSYIFGSIIRTLNHKYTYTLDDLPEDGSFLVDELCYVYEDEHIRSLVNLKDIKKEYPWVQEQPDVVGSTYELVVERILARREHEKVREMLNSDEFILKAEYNAARAYLERMKASQVNDDDHFLDMLYSSEYGAKRPRE